MRCLACDCLLNDFESTRKSAITGEYIDLCNTCYSTIRHNVYTKERIDLMDNSDSFDEVDEKDLTDWN